MNEQNAAYSREQSAAKAEADRLRSAEQAKQVPAVRRTLHVGRCIVRAVCCTLHGWTLQREIEKAKARQEELLAKNTSLRAQLDEVLAQVSA